MYPFIRLGLAMRRARRQPKIGLLDLSEVQQRVGPFDIDVWMELNNGRTLTLYDLARLPHITRTGALKTIYDAGMYATVAGVSVRYRARVRPFTKVAIRTRFTGWDDRFLYIEQSMWQGEVCANHMLLRQAFARRGQGLVPPAKVAELCGFDPVSPPLPDWVQNWIAAEATRPWPPQMVAPSQG